MCSESRSPPHVPVTEGPLFAWRAISALLPILVTLFLPVIAFASPPDPSWIAGIYDGADGDDVVMTVYDTVATDGARLAPIPQLSGRAELLFERSARGVPNLCLVRAPRAPPCCVVHGIESCLQLPVRLQASSRSSKDLVPSFASLSGPTNPPQARAVAEVDNFMTTRTEETLDVVVISKEWP